MRSTRWIGIALAVLLTVPFAACQPAASSTGPTTGRKTDNATGNLAAGAGESRDLTTNVSGSVNLTLDWDNADNDHDLYVTSPLCPSGDDASEGTGVCVNFAKADSETAKPEQVTFEVPANSARRIWVVNFGPGSDSYRLTLEYPDQQ